MKTVLIVLFALLMLYTCTQGNQVNYRQVIAHSEAVRKNMADQSGKMEEKMLTDSCSSVLFTTLVDSVFPAWYGTPWDFNGTSNMPCEGKIACGYFVSTTLQHVGFNLNRYKLAQQASETIVKEFCGSGYVKRYTSLNLLLEYLKEQEDGLYIIGLNYHVGFMVVRQKQVYFVHSDYFSGEVKSEIASNSYGLLSSSVFVLGQITHNPGVMKSWMKGERVY